MTAMLSRVAENVYWMARYVERAENTARLVNVNTQLLMDLPGRVRFGWDTLVEITGGEEVFRALRRRPTERNVVRFMTGDRGNPGSILSSLAAARAAARAARDILPHEAWEQVNAVYLEAERSLALRPGLPRARFGPLNEVVLGCQLVVGILEGTMSRDAGFEFLRAGRHLERADMTTRIIDVRSASLIPGANTDLTPFENILWMGVLRSLSGYQMYRRRTHGIVRRPDVLAFLLKDADFPRSFLRCVSRVEGSLHNLPHHAIPLRTAASVRRLVAEVAPGELTQIELHQFIDDLQLGLAALDQQIQATYFRHPTGELAPPEEEKEAVRA